LEHALLGIRYLLHQAIPDKPEWVRVALATLNHQSKEALKREVSPTVGIKQPKQLLTLA